METAKRKSKFVAFVGCQGCGKTTLLKSIISKANQRCLYISCNLDDIAGIPRNALASKEDFDFSGVTSMWSEEYTSAELLEKLAYFSNGIVVLDDARVYLSARTQEDTRKIIATLRHRAVDVFLVTHGITEIPPAYFTFLSEIFLFKTTDNFIKRKRDISPEIYEIIERTIKKVWNGAKANPHYYLPIRF
jgi:ABC-type nitrate/sulfonate/bicarbonate transport system ATPase subunit